MESLSKNLWIIIVSLFIKSLLQKFQIGFFYEAFTVKHLAQGHKCHDRDPNPNSIADNARARVRWTWPLSKDWLLVYTIVSQYIIMRKKRSPLLFTRSTTWVVCEVEGPYLLTRAGTPFNAPATPATHLVDWALLVVTDSNHFYDNISPIEGKLSISDNIMFTSFQEDMAH